MTGLSRSRLGTQAASTPNGVLRPVALAKAPATPVGDSGPRIHIAKREHLEATGLSGAWPGTEATNASASVHQAPSVVKRVLKRINLGMVPPQSVWPSASRRCVIGEAVGRASVKSVGGLLQRNQAVRKNRRVDDVARSNWQGQTRNQPGRQNQSLEQTRDSVLRYGEVVGCELLNFFVRPLR